MNTKQIIPIIIILAVSLAACTTPPAQDDHHEMALPEIVPVSLASGEKLNVIATTSIIGDVVGNIGGEQINLTTIMQPGQDPHSYQPTPEDMKAIESANIIFVNGLDLEEGLMEIIENTASGYIVPVSAGLEPHEHEEDADEHSHAAGDPHFWVDPNNVIIWIENITFVFTSADPANEDSYISNNASYLVELLDIDDFIREQINSIPDDHRKIVTDHKLFHYYAERYGLEVIGTVIPSASTSGGPSAADAAALVKLLQAEGISAIFVGTTSTDELNDLVASIAAESGLEIEIRTLLTGSLAPEGQPGDTYLEYLKYNTDQIVSGLRE